MTRDAALLDAQRHAAIERAKIEKDLEQKEQVALQGRYNEAAPGNFLADAKGGVYSIDGNRTLSDSIARSKGRFIKDKE